MRFFVAVIVALFLIGSFMFVDARTKDVLHSNRAPTEPMLQDMFASFMKQYSKSYSTDEFGSRYNVFKTNVDIIRTHNVVANSTWTMGLNEFADLSFDEFKSKYFGYNHVDRNYIRSQNLHEPSNVAQDTSVDWRTKNAVTPVKDQGQCGSCWAFSATGSIEGAWALAKGQLVSLSEQQLNDCSDAQGNAGCNGGLMDYAFEYVIANGGICTESAYPYKGTDNTCVKTCDKAVTISSYKDVAAGDENSLYSAVGTVGPVSVAIEADQLGFQFYSSGVFSGTCGTNLDHGVLAVGYGVDGSSNYWIVKNSWGASWGESGYIRMIRGKNQCGITLAASYPIV